MATVGDDAARFAREQAAAWDAEWCRTGCFAAKGCSDFWMGKAEGKA